MVVFCNGSITFNVTGSRNLASTGQAQGEVPFLKAKSDSKGEEISEMAVAKLTQTMISGKTVYYIEADQSAISVEDLGGKELTTSTKFGISGTFFDSYTGTVVGIACGYRGKEVRDDGERHANGYTRGTLVAFRPLGTQSQVVSRYVINHIKDSVPLDWIDWAIGGLSLYLNDSSITQDSDLESKLVEVEHGQSVNGVSPAYNTDRAAIGYKSGKIVLACIKNAKPWDCRTIMASLGCYDAVMLDGSTCAQIRAKNASGQIITAGGPRSIYSIVTVDPTTTWL